jgi:hypothetical protein
MVRSKPHGVVFDEAEVAGLHADELAYLQNRFARPLDEVFVPKEHIPNTLFPS